MIHFNRLQAKKSGQNAKNKCAFSHQLSYLRPIYIQYVHTDLCIQCTVCISLGVLVFAAVHIQLKVNFFLWGRQQWRLFDFHKTISPRASDDGKIHCWRRQRLIPQLTFSLKRKFSICELKRKTHQINMFFMFFLNEIKSEKKNDERENEKRSKML